MNENRIKQIHATIERVADGAVANVAGVSGALAVRSMETLLEHVGNFVKDQHVYDVGSSAGHALLSFALCTDAKKVTGCELAENRHMDCVIQSSVNHLKKVFPDKHAVLEAVRVDYRQFSRFPEDVSCVYHFACGFNTEDITTVLTEIKNSPNIKYYFCTKSRAHSKFQSVLSALGSEFRHVSSIMGKLKGSQETHPIWIFERQLESSASYAPKSDSEEEFVSHMCDADGQEVVSQICDTEGRPPKPQKKLGPRMYWMWSSNCNIWLAVERKSWELSDSD